MSKERFDVVGACTIKDTLTNDYIEIDECCELLNQQDQRISELEEQLKSAIVPKFKIGQEVFIIFETTKKKHIVESTNINSITIFVGNELSYYCKYVDGERMYLELSEDELFATKEEALAKLRELQGEKR